mmetsp:Transcript_16720/g.38812  ORF Transcript_16720/g.38812 Transcript_16720/m.38812 type:complete len:218 (+) Transcript_16720:1352-2005(+)
MLIFLTREFVPSLLAIEALSWAFAIALFATILLTWSLVAWVLPPLPPGLGLICPGLCSRLSLLAVLPATQGWLNACSAVYLVSDLISNSLLSRSRALGDRSFAHRGNLSVNFLRRSGLGMLWQSSSNGRHPHSSTKTITPRAHASTDLVYRFLCSISGARYPRVPRKELATGRCSETSFESPKSIIFTSTSCDDRGLCASRRFSGFMSLCITFLECI